MLNVTQIILLRITSSIDPMTGHALAILASTGDAYHLVQSTDEATLRVVSGTLSGTVSPAITIPLAVEWNFFDATITRSGGLIVAYTERTAVGDNLHLLRLGHDGRKDTAFVSLTTF